MERSKVIFDSKLAYFQQTLLYSPSFLPQSKRASRVLDYPVKRLEVLTMFILLLIFDNLEFRQA